MRIPQLLYGVRPEAIHHPPLNGLNCLVTGMLEMEVPCFYQMFNVQTKDGTDAKQLIVLVMTLQSLTSMCIVSIGSLS